MGMHSRGVRLDALTCLLERFPRGPFFTYLRSFFVIFIDALMNVNSTSQPNRWGSRAVAVGLGRPMMFWKAKDLIRNTAEGRQVQRPSRLHKWPWLEKRHFFASCQAK